jgi:tetratricopeptide (TPR) repeat protein
MSSPALQSKEQIADAIVRCIDAKDLRKALAICQQLNRQYPEFAYGWYLASFLMQKVRHYSDAIKAINRALQLAYLDKYQLHKTRCHFEANDIAGAMAAAGILKDKSFVDPLLHSQLGSLLHLLGDNVSALVHYTKAIELDASNAEHYFNRAAVQRYFGDVAGAEAGFDAAIAIKPDEFEAYSGRANLRTQTRERNHIAQLKEVIARTRSPAGLIHLHYALSKELEDIGDFDAAFASLKLGADTKRRHMQYSVDTDLQIIAKICEVYGAELFDGHIQGSQNPDPIFILGMPRTGTTLVERILSSHSSVFSAGELNNFSLELIRLVGRALGPKRPSRLEFVAATAALDFRALGEAYVSTTRPLCDGSPYFIDKLPFNFLYAGLIHLALPRAKIINLQRHSMDTCYAVYKQLFKDAYPFSYDLDELGQYYIAYHHLMQHWNTVMPGVMHTMRYETLVADIEGESRRLLEYCGLPWEDQCLRFHENTRASTTASALQVRQPIYATSVGKWRHYDRQLEPLRERLEDAGIDTN